MKSNLLICFIVLLISDTAFSQITITQADMPQAGDTIRLSNTTDTAGLPTPSYTGAGVTWNYSALVAQRQTIDTFLSVSSTPVLYQIFFNDAILYPADKSTVAQAAPSISFGPISLTNTIDYYKDESNNYESVGYGTTIDGLPTSVKDDTIDVVYNFPMNYGNADSCNSSSHININSLGYYGTHQKRVNHVDGWGTLITPDGTFSVLRVKTLIFATDTIYIDTIIHFGFNQTQPEQIQYKWLGNGIPVPLLQINETVTLNVPTYVNTIYPDKPHSFVGIASIKSFESNIHLNPNPANENSILSYVLPNSSEISMSIFSTDGRCVQQVFEGMQNAGSHQQNINTSGLTPGVYLLKITSSEGQVTRRLAVVR